MSFACALKKITSSIAFATVGLLAAQQALAEVVPQVKSVGVENPASVLFIGNSFFYYNNSMHGHLTRMINASEPKVVPKFRSTSITISGSGLNWHDVDAYFKPNAVGSYSFNADNSVTMNKLDKLFDVAIIMDCSQCPVHPELGKVFTEYAKKHSDTIRKNGAKPAFFMSWAYADKPEMTKELADAYTKAGNDNGVFVIPAGLAFAKSIAVRPDLNLYEADKRHPSLMGTYLGAATVYAALYGKSPAGNKYKAGLDDATALHLQNAAWEAVQGYLKK